MKKRAGSLSENHLSDKHLRVTVDPDVAKRAEQGYAPIHATRERIFISTGVHARMQIGLVFKQTAVYQFHNYEQLGWLGREGEGRELLEDQFPKRNKLAA